MSKQAENTMIYLDYNATSPVDPRVLEAMLPFYRQSYGNPSSVYRFAQQARKAVEDARSKVAKLINADPREIFFTSGGTEADNLAIKGITAVLAKKGKHILTSKIEHHAVLEPVKFLSKNGFLATFVDVDEYGMIDLNGFKESIREDTILASVMFANNEVGTIQPIKELAAICYERGVVFHTDAVQAVGKLEIDVKELAVGALSLSAHKFQGPKGVGALYLRKGVSIAPLFLGGGHERGFRSGTENVGGIVGLGVAAYLASKEMVEDQKRIKSLRDKLEKAITSLISETKVNGHPSLRLDSTLNVCMRYIEGEGILISLDFEGVCASSGSACTSGSLDPSHVLLAMGIPHEIAHGSLRLSLGKFTTEAEIDKVIEVLPGIIERLRVMSPFWKKGKQ